MSTSIQVSTQKQLLFLVSKAWQENGRCPFLILHALYLYNDVSGNTFYIVSMMTRACIVLHHGILRATVDLFIKYVIGNMAIYSPDVFVPQVAVYKMRIHNPTTNKERSVR
jgi:hypothetical protein